MLGDSILSYCWISACDSQTCINSFNFSPELLPVFPASCRTFPPEFPFLNIPWALKLKMSKYELIKFPPNLLFFLCSLFPSLAPPCTQTPQPETGKSSLTHPSPSSSMSDQSFLCLPFLHSPSPGSVICCFKITLPALQHTPPPTAPTPSSYSNFIAFKVSHSQHKSDSFLSTYIPHVVPNL